VIEKIIAACKASGADAVHPGYGFLSENEDFADACTAAGITFVGPSADAIAQDGEQDEARKTVSAAGTPVVRETTGRAAMVFRPRPRRWPRPRRSDSLSSSRRRRAGGGKGMRLVANEAGFTAAFDGARREATSAFGDGTVYLEKAIERPRHIEIQVFGDTLGNLVHLGERDCSIQRRHQKVIERRRRRSCRPSCARRWARRRRGGARGEVRRRRHVRVPARYGWRIYFLEMNTRLQVEHP